MGVGQAMVGCLAIQVAIIVAIWLACWWFFVVLSTVMSLEQVLLISGEVLFCSH